MAKKVQTIERELDVLLSNKELTINDKQIIVKRFSLLNTFRITANLQSIVNVFVNNPEATSSALSKIAFVPKEDENVNVNSIRAIGIIELISVFGEEIADIIADIIVKSTTLTKEEVEAIDNQEGIDLLIAIYEVNKGFFTKCMTKLEKRLRKMVEEQKEKEQTPET